MFESSVVAAKEEIYQFMHEDLTASFFPYIPTNSCFYSMFELRIAMYHIYFPPKYCDIHPSEVKKKKNNTGRYEFASESGSGTPTPLL